MTNETVVNLVNVLRNDPGCINSWSQIADKLKIDPGLRFTLDTRVNQGTIEFYDLFKTLLGTWISNQHPENVSNELNLILKSLGLKRAAAYIQKPLSLKKNPYREAYGHLVGRQNEFEELRQLVDKEEKVVVIGGQAGVGKTLLARKMCYDLVERDIQCVWLTISSNQDIKDNVFSLVKKHLMMESDEKSLASSPLSLLFHNLAKHLSGAWGRWVLVLDGVNGPSEELTSIVAHEEPQLTLLITTRYRQLLRKAPFVSVDCFSDVDAEKFICAKLPELRHEWQVLCDCVSRNPLAIESACAYIVLQRKDSNAGNTYSITMYKEKMDKQGSYVGLEEDVSKVLRVFWGSLRWNDTKISQEHHGYHEILQVLALLNERRITLTFLHNLCSTMFNLGEEFTLEHTENTVQFMKANSLLSCDNNEVSITKMMQLVLLKEMEGGMAKGEHDGFKRCTSGILKEVLLNYETVCKDKNELSHICTLWGHTVRFMRSGEGLAHVAVKLLRSLVKLYACRDALKFGGQCRATLASFHDFQKENELKLQILGVVKYLAQAHVQLGEYHDALTLLDDTIDDTALIPNASCIEYYDILYEKGKTFYEAENYPAALDAFKSVCKETKFRAEKTKDRDMKEKFMRCLHNLASVYKRRGDYDQSQMMYMNVLEYQIMELGAESEEALRTKHSIGHQLFLRGEFREAETQLRHVYHSRCQSQSKEHQNEDKALITYQLVARCLLGLGKKEEALTILEDVKKRQQKWGIVGQDSEKTQLYINQIKGIDFIREPDTETPRGNTIGNGYETGQVISSRGINLIDYHIRKSQLLDLQLQYYQRRCKCGPT